MPYPGGPDVRYLTLHITPTATTTVTVVGTTTITISHVITGTRMFYVSAKDDKFGGTQDQRYWAGILTVGDTDSYGNNRDLPAVTARPNSSDENYPFMVVEQGTKPYTDSPGPVGGAGNQPVTVTTPAPRALVVRPTGFVGLAHRPDDQHKAGKHPGGTFGLKPKVAIPLPRTPPRNFLLAPLAP
jgi:hypothetical protein